MALVEGVPWVGGIWFKYGGDTGLLSRFDGNAGVCRKTWSDFVLFAFSVSVCVLIRLYVMACFVHQGQKQNCVSGGIL